MRAPGSADPHALQHAGSVGQLAFVGCTDLLVILRQGTINLKKTFPIYNPIIVRIHARRTHAHTDKQTSMIALLSLTARAMTNAGVA